jgi:hypothetical protein
MRNATDNRLHFSELCEMSRSPAHYKYACENPSPMTRAMTVGAICDAIVFETRKWAIYPGKVRNGKEWDLFAQLHKDQVICIQSEYEEAIGAAEAVLNDPVIRSMGLLNGERQRCMQWEYQGVSCAAGIPGQRGGFDVLGAAFIFELKATANAEPYQLKKHAFRMLWHAQLAFYKPGAESIGHKIEHCYIGAVEQSPPHAVTVLELSPEVIESGSKSISRWIEMYKACELSGVWPGYVQSAETWELEEWQRDEGD